jgi:D-alanyl-D-alanine carboxypeptidase
MFKPKGEKSSKPLNSNSRRFISTVAILLALGIGSADLGTVANAVETASPSPTASAPATTSSPTPSAPANSAPTSGTVRDPIKLSVDKFNSLWVVVNKQRPLSFLKYVPKNLTKPPFKFPATHNPYGVVMTKDAGIALVAMAKAMAVEGGGTLVASSGYRSYLTQVDVHSRQVARFGLKAGEALAARPGYSEHQTGLAVDVYAAGQDCRIYTCFANTVAGKWLANNAHRFGFVLRYQQNQAAITGYQFEPWHFRYVGIELSTQFKKSGKKSLEAYFGLPAAPNY